MLKVLTPDWVKVPVAVAAEEAWAVWPCDGSVAVAAGSVHCPPQHCTPSPKFRVASSIHCDVLAVAIFDDCLYDALLWSFFLQAAFVAAVVAVVPRCQLLLVAVGCVCSHHLRD